MARAPISAPESRAAGDFAPLRSSFVRHLRAENKSPSTVVTYTKAIDQLAAFLASSGMPTAVSAVTREHVEAFLISRQVQGFRPATVAQRIRSLQQFFRWLRDEGEIRESPMHNMRARRRPRPRSR